MGLFGDVFSSLGRGASSALGGIGGFLGDIAGGFKKGFEPGPFGGGGGLAGTIGGRLGQSAENIILASMEAAEQRFQTGERAVIQNVRRRLGAPSPAAIRLPATIPVVLGGERRSGGIGADLRAQMTRIAQEPRLTTQPVVQQAGIFPEFDLPSMGDIGSFLGGIFAPETEAAMPGHGGEMVVLPGGSIAGGLAEFAGLGMGVSQLAMLPPGIAFRPSMAGLRARRELTAINPLTGSISVFRNMGRPVLYTGDFAAAKRVRRVASRARRRMGG